LDEIKDLQKQYSSHEIKATGVLGSLGRSEVQRNALSTIDQWMLNGVCPDTWKYISYGIAVK
jgi:hypothetical protein